MHLSLLLMLFRRHGVFSPATTGRRQELRLWGFVLPADRGEGWSQMHSCHPDVSSALLYRRNARIAVRQRGQESHGGRTVVCSRLVFTRLQALKVRQADVTRETVQKSVCVLSRVVGRRRCSAFQMLCCSFAHLSVLPQPLYGLLQAKLQLITHAYFEEKDFSQISILKVRIGVRGSPVSWSSWMNRLFSAGAVRAHERLSEGFCSGGLAALSRWVTCKHLRRRQFCGSPAVFAFMSFFSPPRLFSLCRIIAQGLNTALSTQGRKDAVRPGGSGHGCG